MTIRSRAVRREGVIFSPGDETRGRYPYIGHALDERGRIITVIPCLQHARCWGLVKQIREQYDADPDATGHLDVKIEVDLTLIENPVSGKRTFVAHLPEAEKPKLADPWTDAENIRLPGSVPARQLINLGRSEAGAASCWLVIYDKTAVMIDCGISVGRLPGASEPRSTTQTNETETEEEISSLGSSFDDQFLLELLAKIEAEEAKIKEAQTLKEALPDFDALSEILDSGVKLEAIFVSHGHMDHFAGMGYLAERFFPDGNLPTIYGSAFTRSSVYRHLVEHFKSEDDPTTHRHFSTKDIKPDEVVEIGPIRIKAFEVLHSVPGSLGFAVQTTDNSGQIVITGDFKARFKQATDRVNTAETFAAIGLAKVLIADATNAYVPDWSELESATEEGILAVLLEAPGRVIVSFISSHLERLLTTYRLARRLGKTITYFGASLDKTITTAADCNLSLPVISQGNVNADVVIVTGCQADFSSVLARLSDGQSIGGLRIQPGDTIIHSTRPIPGRYWPVVEMLRRLQNLGAEVFIDTNFPGPDVMYGFPRRKLHVSGHGYQGDLRVALEEFKPKFFLPIHASGPAREQAAELAWQKHDISAGRTLLIRPTTFTIEW